MQRIPYPDPAKLSEAMRKSLETYSKGERPTVAVIEARLGSVSELAKGFDTAAAGAARRERRRAAARD